jgi:uncharacterized protein (DUF58 family)
VATTGTTQSSVQPRGALLGGMGLVLFAAGMWRIDGVLASLGLAAWCLLVLAIGLGRGNLKRLTLQVEAPHKVVAGTGFPMRISLLNQRGLLDAFGVTFEVELPGKVRLPGRSAWLPAGSGSDLNLRVKLPERAATDRHVVRLASHFPLGLFHTQRSFEIDHPLLVLPRPVTPRGLNAAGVLMDASPNDGASAGETAGEPRGLRPWRPDDSPRKIHWPASIRAYAAGTEPLVREADPPGFHPRSCVVVFHSFGTDGRLIRPDQFERALSLVAGSLRYLHSLGVPAMLVADVDDWKEHPATTRAQLAVCQEVLARAKRSSSTEAHDLQAAIARAGQEQSLIVISDMPVAGWRLALPKRILPPVTLEPQRSRRRGIFAS